MIAVHDTSSICDRVQDAIAAGDPAAHADHLASCAACRGIAEAARRATDLRADTSASLSPGVRARLMAGGRARSARRRRRQRTFTALGAAAAAGALWFGLSSTDRRPPTVETLPLAQASGDSEDEAFAPPAAEIDALLAPTARWDYVEEPLDPYRRLAGSIEAADSETGGVP